MSTQIVTSHELNEELKQTADTVFTLPVGFPSLDRMLGGVEGGELVIVTGPTGEGKTTLLMSITSHMAEQKIGTTWFTLEVTPRQFISKITKASNGVLPLFYLPKSGFDDVNQDAVKGWERKTGRRFEMIDWIEIKIKEAIERGAKEGMPIKAIFIDHIHQIFNLARVQNNVSLEIGEMVGKIKQIAIENELVIFLIAHTKDDPQGTVREPRKEDIRDSGLVSRLADSIIGVWRIPNSDDGKSTRRKEINEGDVRAKVRVFKNRREGTVGAFVAEHVNHKLQEIDDFNGI